MLALCLSTIVLGQDQQVKVTINRWFGNAKMVNATIFVKCDTVKLKTTVQYNESKTSSAKNYLQNIVEATMLETVFGCKFPLSFEPLETGSVVYINTWVKDSLGRSMPDWQGNTNLEVSLAYKAINGLGNFIMNTHQRKFLTKAQKEEEDVKTLQKELADKKLMDDLAAKELAYKRSISKTSPECINCDSIVNLILSESPVSKHFKYNTSEITVNIVTEVQLDGKMVNYKIKYITEPKFKLLVEKYLDKIRFKPAINELNEPMHCTYYAHWLKIKPNK